MTPKGGLHLIAVLSDAFIRQAGKDPSNTPDNVGLGVKESFRSSNGAYII